MALRIGDRVRLACDNPRLHGKPAVVESLTAYGAVVLTAAAGSGRWRALSSEMMPEGPVLPPSGDLCDRCGSPNMTRAGSCLLCRDCGNMSGGCS
jgi:hypothetical protein